MARAAKQVWIPSRQPWGGRHERRPGLGWVRAMRAKLLRSGRSQAVKLISVVVFRFRQKASSFPAVVSSSSWRSHAAASNAANQRLNSAKAEGSRASTACSKAFRSAMVCLSDSPLISLSRTAWRRLPLKPPTAAALPSNSWCATQQLVYNSTAVQPGCRDLPLEPPQRLPYAIGRSPSWPSLRANPKHRKGSVGAPGRLQRIANQT